jgi:hypothetical protein
VLAFLGGECERCGLRDERGLVIVQPPNEKQSTNELYTLMLHDPELARSTLRVLCATCRQIERVHHSAASPAPQPSASPLDQPSDASPSDHSSSERRRSGFLAGAGAELADSDGVDWGSDF